MTCDVPSVPMRRRSGVCVRSCLNLLTFSALGARFHLLCVPVQLPLAIPEMRAGELVVVRGPSGSSRPHLAKILFVHEPEDDVEGARAKKAKPVKQAASPEAFSSANTKRWVTVAWFLHPSEIPDLGREAECHITNELYASSLVATIPAEVIVGTATAVVATEQEAHLLYMAVLEEIAAAVATANGKTARRKMITEPSVVRQAKELLNTHARREGKMLAASSSSSSSSSAASSSARAATATIAQLARPCPLHRNVYYLPHLFFVRHYYRPMSGTFEGTLSSLSQSQLQLQEGPVVGPPYLYDDQEEAGFYDLGMACRLFSGFADILTVPDPSADDTDDDDDDDDGDSDDANDVEDEDDEDSLAVSSSTKQGQKKEKEKKDPRNSNSLGIDGVVLEAASSAAEKSSPASSAVRSLIQLMRGRLLPGLEAAARSLRLNHVLPYLPRREHERTFLRSTLSGKIAEGTSLALFISGQPGTGKTALCNEVIRGLMAAQKTAKETLSLPLPPPSLSGNSNVAAAAHSSSSSSSSSSSTVAAEASAVALQPFRVASVNCLSLPSPLHLYSELVQQLGLGLETDDAEEEDNEESSGLMTLDGCDQDEDEDDDGDDRGSSKDKAKRPRRSLGETTKGGPSKRTAKAAAAIGAASRKQTRRPHHHRHYYLDPEAAGDLIDKFFLAEAAKNTALEGSQAKATTLLTGTGGASFSDDNNNSNKQSATSETTTAQPRRSKTRKQLSKPVDIVIIDEIDFFFDSSASASLASSSSSSSSSSSGGVGAGGVSIRAVAAAGGGAGAGPQTTASGSAGSGGSSASASGSGGSASSSSARSAVAAGVLYRLLDWCQLRGSRLILIMIGNDPQLLPSLAGKQGSRGALPLVIPQYDRTDMMAIVVERMKSLAGIIVGDGEGQGRGRGENEASTVAGALGLVAEAGDPAFSVGVTSPFPPVFEKGCLQLAAGKGTSKAGDFRSYVTILSQAINIAQARISSEVDRFEAMLAAGRADSVPKATIDAYEALAAPAGEAATSSSASSAPSSTGPSTAGMVTRADVASALAKHSGTGTESVTAQALRSCSTWERQLLITLAVHKSSISSTSTAREIFTIEELHDRLVALVTSSGLEVVQAPTHYGLPDEDVPALARALSAQPSDCSDKDGDGNDDDDFSIFSREPPVPLSLYAGSYNFLAGDEGEEMEQASSSSSSSSSTMQAASALPPPSSANSSQVVGGSISSTTAAAAAAERHTERLMVFLQHEVVRLFHETKLLQRQQQQQQLGGGAAAAGADSSTTSVAAVGGSASSPILLVPTVAELAFISERLASLGLVNLYPLKGANHPMVSLNVIIENIQDAYGPPPLLVGADGMPASTTLNASSGPATAAERDWFGIKVLPRQRLSAAKV